MKLRALLMALVTVLVLAGCETSSVPGPSTSSGAGSTDAATPAGGPVASPVAAASSSGAQADPSQEVLPPDVGQARLDVTPGEVLATRVITPWDGGAVTGTAADGTVYSLRVPPWALTEPTEIGLRPLTGSTDLGPIVAGAAFEPAGTVFAIPAILTIRGPGAQVTNDTVAFDYRGAPADGPAALRILPDQDGTQVTMLVQHFSGSVAVDVGKDANSLYEKWAAAGGGDTARGRQAAAETRYAAADLAARQGRISDETAQGIKDRAAQEWLDAEREILRTDSEISRMANGGKPADAAKLKAELAKVANFTTATDTGDGKLNLADVIQITAEYQEAIAKTIDTDPAFNRAVDSGLDSDAPMIEEALGLLVFLERDIELWGGNSNINALGEVGKITQRVEDAILRRCRTPSKTPINPQRLLGIQRQLAFISAGRSDAVLACLVQTPAPSAGDVVASGTVHVTMSVAFAWGDDRLDADLNVLLAASPQTGGLVFAPGSTADLAYKAPEPTECHSTSCPTAACPVLVAGVSERGLTVGSSGDGAAITGEVIGGLEDGPLKLGLTLPLLGTGYCQWGGIPLMCPQEGYLVGDLVGSTPREWRFVCTVAGDGYSISSSGSIKGH